MGPGWRPGGINMMIKPRPDKPRTTERRRDLETIRITYVHQIQPERGRRDARQLAISGCQYLTNPGHGSRATTDSHQGAGDISHHMVEKRIGLHINYDVIAFSGYFHMLHKPVRGP